MPVPIMRMRDESRDGGGGNSNNIDYSFLAAIPGIGIDSPAPSTKKKVFASNRDAEMLFKIWTLAEKNNDSTLNVSDKFSSRDVMRLKVGGFVSGQKESLTLTDKGKKVIKTMALGETSKFLKNQKSKSYSDILASMDKRNKSGYRIPKMAHNTYSSINLRTAWNKDK